MFLFNKKGQMTMWIFAMFVLLIVGIIFIFIGGLITIKTYNVLNIDMPIGNVNLQNMTENSFGQFYDMYVNNADWWGISLTFGMILGLFLSAYITRNTIPKWGLVFDIFIIIGAFFFSLYLSSTYSGLLNSLASANETFLEDYTPKTSTFIINLPIFTVIIGAITMFLFHSSIPKKKEEQEYQSGGYLQGV